MQSFYWRIRRVISLCSTAGLCVDLALFPVDTIKTRLQSYRNNVQRTPGSLRLFAGLPAVIVGSAPAAAAFFVVYETVKENFKHLGVHPVYYSMISACIAEVVACVIRVPCEVVKQRAQNHPSHGVSTGVRGFYRGYISTLSREIPFSFIQYPIWEYLKVCLFLALCGCLAGTISGAVTTPLDVAKTRIMLAEVSLAFLFYLLCACKYLSAIWTPKK
ncbi:unnamed protein product [Trichobilharzia regenti]|nr:unnamed protein product [Trichobilharzia regenti]